MDFDSKRSNLEQKFLEPCSKIVQTQGYDLYDLEYIQGSKTLRVFISKPETNTADINDCMTIDRAMSEFFETSEWIPENIVLEVSSPGLFRKVKTFDQLENCKDERILLNLNDKLERALDEDKIELINTKNPKFFKKNKSERKIVGVLKNLSQDKLHIITDENIDIELRLDIVKKVNVEPNLF